MIFPLMDKEIEAWEPSLTEIGSWWREAKKKGTKEKGHGEPWLVWLSGLSTGL